jgi:hypothetical protein
MDFLILRQPHFVIPQRSGVTIGEYGGKSPEASMLLNVSSVRCSSSAVASDGGP